jgi:hypothetical protein
LINNRFDLNNSVIDDDGLPMVKDLVKFGGCILYWLGVHNTLSNIPIDHARQFCRLVNNAKFVKGVFNIVWMACTHVVNLEGEELLFISVKGCLENLLAIGGG